MGFNYSHLIYNKSCIFNYSLFKDVINISYFDVIFYNGDSRQL